MKLILSIDDDDSIHALLKAFLKSKYEVISARNGIEALELLKSGGRKPDLILLDMNMPEMNGLTFRKNLDADPMLKSIPVIYLTADNQMSEKVTHSMTYDFLNKPIDKEDLLYILDTHFRLRNHQE